MPAPARRGWVLLTALLFVMLSSAPATAHTNLISTNPPDCQTLTTAPQSVSLRFAADLLTAGARLVAKDASGTQVALGEATVDGGTLTAAWPASTTSGQFSVAYRAVASDGHPLEGSFAFSIEPPKGSSGTPEASAPPPESAVPLDSASPAAAEQPANPESSGVNPLVWGLLVAGVLGIAALIWRARAD